MSMINTIKRHGRNKDGGLFRLPFFLLSFILGLLTMTAFSNASADNTSTLEAWFKLVPETDSLLVLPMSQAKNEILVRYEISATKIGPAGRSQSNQGGQKLLSSQQEVSLSTLQFGLNPEDHFEFKMRIFINDAIVTTATAKYP